MVICPEVVGVFGVFMKGDGDMSNINFTGLSKVAKDVGTVAVGGVGATIASGGGSSHWYNCDNGGANCDTNCGMRCSWSSHWDRNSSFDRCSGK